MRQFSGCRRWVFNHALALKKETYEKDKTSLRFGDTCKLITAWKATPETAWLAAAPSQSLQQSLKDLDRAYSNFFKGLSDFPTFKKKGQRDSFRYPQGFKVEQHNNRLFLPKLGWIQYRNSRAVLGEVKNITVSQSGGKWFASIQTEREVETPRHASSSMVGIDLGVAKFAVLSTGEVFIPCNSFKRHQGRLKRAQRSLSRKVKFSNNWRKARARVTRLHSRIGNVRNDYLHKASNEISKNHAMIVLEDLKVANMSRSASGGKEEPGTNVRAKSGLNRSILDQGWGEFRRQIEYKEAWRGGNVIAIPPQNTSRTCHECGHVSKGNRKSQARFECEACGHETNADLNAAKNILAAGHAVLACGVTSPFRASAQEPSKECYALAA